jgi:dolichol-phosphate mannosyltransferase
VVQSTTLMPNYLVIVPTYNEANNLPLLAKALMKIESQSIHLLVVDDNSPDGTGNIANDLSAEYAGRIHVLHRSSKSGLGRAYIEGFGWALSKDYEYVAQMDADLSHDPQALVTMFLDAHDADVVLGSRYMNGVSVINWPLRRILLSQAANEYVRIVLGLDLHDITSGFRIYRTTALRQMDLPSISSNGYSFQVEMTYRAVVAGCRVIESPIIFTERRSGQSKMSQGVILESALMPWRLRLGRRSLVKRLAKAG